MNSKLINKNQTVIKLYTVVYIRSHVNRDPVHVTLDHFSCLD